MQQAGMNAGTGAAGSPNQGQAAVPVAGRRGVSGWVDPGWLHSARHVLGNQAGFLILYLVVIQVGGFLAGLVAQWEWNLLTDPVPPHRDMEYIYQQTDVRYAGMVNMMAGLCGLAFLVLVRRRQITDGGPDGIFHRSVNRMTWPVFLGCFLLLFAAQTIASIYGIGLDWTTKTMGLTSISTTSEAIEAASGSIPMFLYTCFVAPVVEEVVFRGAILNSLKPYGRVFAIVTTATMFGFFHGDLTQGLFAFAVGLLLGYLSCEYSIFWSILLHIGNNLVISQIGDALVSHMSQNLANYVGLLELIVGGLSMVVVIYLGRHRIRAFITANRTYSNAYAAWANPFFVILLVLEGLSMVWLLVA